MTCPLPTNDDGLYQIVQPARGMTPKRLQVTLEEGTFEVSDFVRQKTRSKVFPDVLLYEECYFVEEPSYTITD